MRVVKLWMVLSAVLFTSHIYSQDFESNSKRELNFAFEVKQIDEFFERFNNDQNSLLASYVKLKYPEIAITRVSLLKSLFNDAGRSDPDSIRDFCTQVADSAHPEFLDFYGGEWYAEALCKFKLNGVVTDVPVLLKIQQEANGGAKWVIVSAYSRRLGVSTRPVVFPMKESCCKFLNPMSHATNFISLSRAFRDKTNLADYLAPGFLRVPSSKAFIRALLNDQLEYMYVKQIRYHFLQIDGWVFTVERYNRNSVHSGWLVSKLIKANEFGKQIYRTSLIRRGELAAGKRK